MKVYVNNLGITCVEPDEGYLLKKGDMICKKAYLGINDRAELYEPPYVIESLCQS